MSDHSLSPYLNIGRESCVALIGGGGKTTLMLSLARELREARQAPVVTTTTKIWIPENMPLILGDAGGLPAALATSGIACFGRLTSPEGKLEGPDPRALCELLAQGIGPILVEADGSAGRSLKVHAAHEPVVPDCSTDALIVAGVDAVGREAGDDDIHRASLAHSVFGWTAETRITPDHVATLLNLMSGFVPSGSRTWFVLNKVDSEHDLRAADEIAARLVGSRNPVLMTSRGRVVATAEQPAPTGAAFS